MEQQNQQLDLRTKSVVELKALAYDLSGIAQQYTQLLQAVSQEINGRVAEEQKAAQSQETTADPVSSEPTQTEKPE